MGIRLSAVFIMAVLVSGCATTSVKQPPVSQLQVQVADLQQRLETQEKEIVDLKYEIKEMASRAEAEQVVTLEESLPTPPTVSSSRTVSPSSDIIRVNATGLEIQRALKGAGFYDGKIDGKIGAGTKAAIVEFQRQHNLKADGVIGQKTWGELRQYLTN